MLLNKVIVLQETNQQFYSIQVSINTKHNINKDYKYIRRTNQHKYQHSAVIGQFVNKLINITWILFQSQKLS